MTTAMSGLVIPSWPSVNDGRKRTPVESGAVVYDVLTAQAQTRSLSLRGSSRISHNPLEEKSTAMTASPSIDPAEFLHEAGVVLPAEVARLTDDLGRPDDSPSSGSTTSIP